MWHVIINGAGAYVCFGRQESFPRGKTQQIAQFVGIKHGML